MSTQQIITLIQTLPEDLKQEAVHFLEYLEFKQEKRKQATSTKKRGGLGSMKGEVWMAEDFDAPLEEFKDYM